MRWMASILALVVIAGCEGSEGPMGPAGPQGPPGADGLPGPAGPEGASNRLVVIDTADDEGVAVAQIPLEVGTDPEDIPLLACYLQNPDFDVWYLVTDGFSAEHAWCQIVFAEGRWQANMFQVPIGWPVAFVVVY